MRWVVFRAALVVAAVLIDAFVQPLGVLRIRVTILDADRRVVPVPSHALLISENPSTSAPRRVVTALDGTAELRLRPGNYTVESDDPLILRGKTYQWSQTLDVVAGQVGLLELNPGNALAEDASSGPPAAASPGGGGHASVLLMNWQRSVLSIWSPTRLGAGFLIDARGLIATNQRLIGAATSVEVQLSSTEKVAARVLVSDPDRNVAILWIDPKAVAAAPPVKLAYADGGPAVADKERIFAINTTIHRDGSVASGTVSRVTPRAILSDIRIDDESLGAPIFNAAGDVIAISIPDEDTSTTASRDARAVRIDDARGLIADAERKMRTADAPSGARLPIEPQRQLDVDALRDAARRRAGNLAPYRVAAADFDVTLFTPVLVFAARRQGQVMDFANWEDYLRDDPPVLLVRATPKLVESFWTTIARGAAQTQGVSLPPIKHIKAGFSRMRIDCGDAEVTPIHPLKIERRVSENDAVYEGLYVLDPAAIGPHCGTVKLTLFSDKDPAKGDTRVVDPKILLKIWEDFAALR